MTNEDICAYEGNGVICGQPRSYYDHHGRGRDHTFVSAKENVVGENVTPCQAQFRDRGVMERCGLGPNDLRHDDSFENHKNFDHAYTPFAMGVGDLRKSASTEAEVEPGVYDLSFETALKASKGENSTPEPYMLVHDAVNNMDPDTRNSFFTHVGNAVMFSLSLSIDEREAFLKALNATRGVE